MRSDGIRKVFGVEKSTSVVEGAGVRLKRAFARPDRLLDPFLLLDDIHSRRPEDYVAGFPWHPHRGIETVTYVIDGEIRHGDSIGNEGSIASGDVQWMTAGSGIIHQEMPQSCPAMMMGFQLWVNLPASGKMMDPRYRGVAAAQIPSVSLQGGAAVKVIAGSLAGVAGPVSDLVVPVEYLDVNLPAGGRFRHATDPRNSTLAYVFEGAGRFDPASGRAAGTEQLVIFGPGGEVDIQADDSGARFLFISGRHLRESVAWRGPIVMNTEEELELAFEEYADGRFIKSGTDQRS